MTYNKNVNIVLENAEINPMTKWVVSLFAIVAILLVFISFGSGAFSVFFLAIFIYIV